MPASPGLLRVSLLIATTIAVSWLMAWAVEDLGFSSPITAFVVNWLVMAWMATVATFIRLPLPSRYYGHSAWERGGLTYEQLGIRFFKRLVRRGPLSIFSRKFRLPRDNATAALSQLDQLMRRAESIHIFSFLAICGVIGYSVLRKRLDAAGWLLLFNSMLNTCPVMLQRYNRIWLEKRRMRNGRLAAGARGERSGVRDAGLGTSVS
jgi:hypothetical protein